jgi:hypothetical protein
MKRTLLAAAATLLLGLAAQTAQADAITVGTANTGNCYPFMCNDSGTSSGPSIQYQQVYSASAFSGPVTITSESFYWMFAQTFGGNDKLLGGTYNFMLSTTTAAVNGLNNSCLSCNIGADNTQVLSFTVPAGGISFGTSFTFDNTTDFSYNPLNGNLLLDIQVTNQDLVPNGSGNSYVDADNTGSVTSRAYAFEGSNSGFADSVGLVTTFGTTSAVPEPSSVLLTATGLFGFGLAGVLRRKRSA